MGWAKMMVINNRFDGDFKIYAGEYREDVNAYAAYGASGDEGVWRCEVGVCWKDPARGERPAFPLHVWYTEDLKESQLGVIADRIRSTLIVNESRLGRHV